MKLGRLNHVGVAIRTGHVLFRHAGLDPASTFLAERES